MLLFCYTFYNYTIYSILYYINYTIYCTGSNPTLSATSRKTLYIVVAAFLFSIYGSICCKFI